jgi:nucleotide-binding universal stress UspA family protein
MYRNILVPLDGSPFGEHALPLALSVARRAGGSLQLVQVLPLVNPIYSEMPFFVDDSTEGQILEHQRRAAQGYLDKTAARLKTLAPSVPITTVTLEGVVETAIRTQVAQSGADVVMMTTHGRGPLARFWMGSVADELVRHLPVPILLVRPAEHAPEFEPEAAVKHILVPLDGEPLAEKMLNPAICLGKLMKADFTLLRVVKPVFPYMAYPAAGNGIAQVAESVLDNAREVEKHRVEDAQEYLEKVAAPLRASGLVVVTRVEVDESPAHAILGHGASADLIAMETHGRGGLARLFMGSTADQVIRGKTVPVLVHRPVDAKA